MDMAEGIAEHRRRNTERGGDQRHWPAVVPRVGLMAAREDDRHTRHVFWERLRLGARGESRSENCHGRYCDVERSHHISWFGGLEVPQETGTSLRAFCGHA